MSEKKVGRKKRESGLEKKSGPEKNGAGKKGRKCQITMVSKHQIDSNFFVLICVKSGLENKVCRKKMRLEKSGPEKKGLEKKAENVKLLWFWNIESAQIFWWLCVKSGLENIACRKKMGLEKKWTGKKGAGKKGVPKQK